MLLFGDRDFREVRAWILRNARPLELALWRFHFEGGGARGVIDALELYRNADGGFGNALEPDNWNPESTPYATDFAIRILRGIGVTDLRHPIYEGALRYLAETPYRDGRGFHFTIPSNDGWPCAIWWKHGDGSGNARQGIGITASLSGFVLRYAGEDTPIYGIARGYAEGLFEGLGEGDLGDMGLFGLRSLCADIRASKLQGAFDLPALEAATRALIRGHFVEYVWSNHQDMATAFPDPTADPYPEYAREVADSLDELIRLRRPGGVWDVPWEWYDGGRHAAEFAIAENWWRSFKAIEKLLFIRSHGRLQVD